MGDGGYKLAPGNATCRNEGLLVRGLSMFAISDVGQQSFDADVEAVLGVTPDFTRGSAELAAMLGRKVRWAGQETNMLVRLFYYTCFK